MCDKPQGVKLHMLNTKQMLCMHNKYTDQSHVMSHKQLRPLQLVAVVSEFRSKTNQTN